MADIPGTIATCYTYGQIIYDYIEKTKNASEERQNYRTVVELVLASLNQVQERCQEAKDGQIPLPLQKLFRPVTNYTPKKPVSSKASIRDRLLNRPSREPASKAPIRYETNTKQPLDGGVWTYESRYESDGVLRLLEDNLKKVKEALPSDNGIRGIVSTMTWFWKDPEVKEQMETIKDQRALIEIMIDEVERMNNRERDTVVLGIDRTLRRVEKTQDDRARADERKEILTWLSPIEVSQRHKTISENTFTSLGWLTEQFEFQYWLTQDTNSFLWIYGESGTGKSVLTAHVADYLRDNSPVRQPLVLKLYIEQSDEVSQTVENLLGSLVKQTVEVDKYGVRSETLKKLHRDASGPNVTDLMGVLSEEFARTSKVYILLDNWNGINEDRRRQLDAHFYTLSQIGNVSIMMTARVSEEETQDRIAECANCHASDLKIYWLCSRGCEGSRFCVDCFSKGYACHRDGHSMVQPDRIPVRMYVTTEQICQYIKWLIESEVALTAAQPRTIDFDMGSQSLSMSDLDSLIMQEPTLKDRIPIGIANVSHGNYWEATVFFKSIKHANDVAEIEVMLQSPPEDLDAKYEIIMERFKKKLDRGRSRRLMFILYWMIHTFRPLSLSEMQQAYFMNLEDTEYIEDAQLRKVDLMMLGDGNIKVDFDDSALRMQATFQVFLEANTEKYFDAKAAQVLDCRILKCLNYDDFAKLSLSNKSDSIKSLLDEMPLIAYACQYWHQHLETLCEDKKVKELLLDFLVDKNKIAAFMQVNDYLGTGFRTLLDVRRGVNGLHLAALYGLDEVIVPLIEEHGMDVNSTDPRYGQTALMYASRNGHLSCVQLLLEQGGSINARSQRGMTAMFEAYRDQYTFTEAHDEVVQLLVSNPELNINALNEQSLKRTVLMMAASDGNDGLVETLLGRSDINMNLTDIDGNTALCLAVSGLHLSTVLLLLEHPDTLIEKMNNSGATPLALAVHYRRHDVVDLLLTKGANFLATGQDGKTPIIRAVEAGDAELVAVFLRHNAPFKQVDSKSRTLLHTASLQGHTDVMSLLLGAGIDLRAQGSLGETALHEACRGGRVEAVELLLSVGADKNAVDKNQRTPLIVTRQNAISVRHHRIMNMLEPNPAGTEPFEQIASHAHELPMWSLAHVALFDEIVRRRDAGILTHPLDRDPDTGNTALHYTVCNPVRLKILRLILDTGIPQTCVNDRQQTALHLSVENGMYEITKALLSYSTPPLEAKDILARTPLQNAYRIGRYDIAVVLVEAGARVNTEDRMRLQLTFLTAVQMGKVRVVQMLIADGADRESPGRDGRKAKQIALDNDDGEMLQALAANPSFYYPVRPLLPYRGSSLGSFMDESPSKHSTPAPAKEPARPLPYRGPDTSKPAFIGRTQEVLKETK